MFCFTDKAVTQMASFCFWLNQVKGLTEVYEGNFMHLSHEARPTP
jgi:hypothetical protein